MEGRLQNKVDLRAKERKIEEGRERKANEKDERRCNGEKELKEM